MKKIILTLVVLGLAGAGFFYWWQNQTDVRALNKTLPEGVKIEKNLFSNEYKVVNNIDGYEFKLPAEWKGLEEIVYVPEREELGYVGSSLNLNGKARGTVGVGIDYFISGGDMESDLELWANVQSDIFGLEDNFSKSEIGTIAVVRTQENVHFGGEYTYFFKRDAGIYSITGLSEGFIKYIIANGQW